MDIGNKIKHLRRRSGLTQEQLAVKIGVSAQSVSKWENAVSMPDIMLLPSLAGAFGVSVDELFDLTMEEKYRRIENRLEHEEELPGDVLKEYEAFLLEALEKKTDTYQAMRLLAHLYHHRMEADARRVRKYAGDAIMMHPEKKDCQWLLNMAWGQRVWDWNMANHSQIIDFYKKVIENDRIEPKTPLPYYYLIDNLLADGRTREAEDYLREMCSLPAHNPVLVPVYHAHIALTRHDVQKAEAEIEAGLSQYSDNGAFLFEVAQFYAGRAEYEKAIDFYERSWSCEESSKPRFTDALDGIATIYAMIGKKKEAAATYDRIIQTLKEEWGFSDDDPSIREVKAKKRDLHLKL